MVKGKLGAAASAAKVRSRVLAFTGPRPSELMRYRPEHWKRATQTRRSRRIVGTEEASGWQSTKLARASSLRKSV